MPEVADIFRPDLDADATLALLGVTYEDIARELQYRAQQRALKARQDMIAAQRAGGERRILRDGDDGGGVDMMIHPVSFHYWGQRLGYECWDDPQFLREYRRDNEASRVKLVSDRTVVTLDSLKDSAPAATPCILDAAGRPMAAAA